MTLCVSNGKNFYTAFSAIIANRNDSRSEEDIYRSLCTFNRNSRCFIAIEIENQVSRKHLLGGALNASVLGRIGVAVGWHEAFQMFLRLRHYILYLKSVGKNTFDASNLLLLKPEQLEQAVFGTPVFVSTPRCALRLNSE